MYDTKCILFTQRVESIECRFPTQCSLGLADSSSHMQLVLPPVSFLNPPCEHLYAHSTVRKGSPLSSLHTVLFSIRRMGGRFHQYILLDLPISLPPPHSITSTSYSSFSSSSSSQCAWKQRTGAFQ